MVQFWSKLRTCIKPNLISVNVSQHERLNSSKSVIMCKTIANCTEDEVLSNLSSHHQKEPSGFCLMIWKTEAILFSHSTIMLDI